MKTKAITCRYVTQTKYLFHLYKMRLTKTSKRIIWEKQTTPILIFDQSPLRYFDESKILELGERVAKNYNALFFMNPWDVVEGKHSPIEASTVDLDPLEFFLICMQLQKEQGDENESHTLG